jgi:GNAT superfamily N-acetyltransferase
MGLEGVIRGRRRRTTVPEPSAPRPPELVDRDFTASRPDQLWVANMTYVRTWSGWAYVAFVLDVCSRKIVGRQAAHHMYYGGEPVPGDPEQIRRALFSDRPAATVLLAREGDSVLGLASYTFLWPAAGAETSLYLKELYVRRDARRGGAARALMAELRNVAAESGCSRIEWTADADNSSALAFYKALGVEPKDGKVCYRFAR